MLYLFDLDGTLITSYMDRPDRDFAQWAPLPGRSTRLAELRAAGHQVGLVTNQAGVAFGHVSEADVSAKLAAVLAALDLPLSTPVRVAHAHASARIAHYRDPAEVARRKPSGAMIRELMLLYPEQAAQGVVYVGDRPEDKAAAADARVRFVWAHDFFADDAAGGPTTGCC
jgi:D-glycero-D-manno-heptose 1,7-bisphosphate phosphatase